MEGIAVDLKTYQAYTMAEALAAVKRDLGPSAVILNTRSFKRGGIFGLGRRTIIEVTASMGRPINDAKSSAGNTGARRSKPAAAVKAYANLAKPPAENGSIVAAPEDKPPTDLDRQRTRRLAQAMLERHERRQRESKTEPVAYESLKPSPELGVVDSPQQEESRPVDAATVQEDSGEPSTVAQRYYLKSPGDAAPASLENADATNDDTESERIRSSAQARAASFLRGPSSPAGEPIPDAGLARQVSDAPSGSADPKELAMHDELAAIRHMVGEVLHRQVTKTGPSTPSMPQKLFDMYLRMVGQELSEELADRIINEVRDELTGSELENEQTVRHAVCQRLAEYIPAADQALPERGPGERPLTIALVGPTGVGKTTTVAKLAASFKLRQGKKVGLVTADTYRIAAVDQLRTYANIIGLPLKVVLTPSEMRQAVRSLGDCDVIMIDTAGRSQNDTTRIDELKEFVAAANPHEVHLVLSSTAGEKVLLREVEAFGEVGVDKVVLTKLDEAVSFGMLVNLARKIGKQFSFFTTGQEVPDHIEIGRSERLAELVIGENSFA